MAEVVTGVKGLVEIYDKATAFRHGGTDFWTPVTVTVTKLMTNCGEASPEGHWAAVEIQSMKIGEQEVDLGGRMHSHISLGKWRINPDQWRENRDKAEAALTLAIELKFEVMLDAVRSGQPQCYFYFWDESTGLDTLESLSRTLSWDMWYLERRHVSPPGRVYHLSVYDYSHPQCGRFSV